MHRKTQGAAVIKRLGMTTEATGRLGVATVTGMPATSINFGASETYSSLIDVAASVEVELHSRESAVSDILYRVVGSVGLSKASRRLVLDARRKLHGSRTLSTVESAELDAVLQLFASANETSLVQDYIALLLRRSRLERSLDRLLSTIELSAVSSIRSLWHSHQDIRDAIAYASPELYQEFSKVSAGAPRTQALSSAELSVARYMIRSATKCSSYSLFAMQLSAGWDDSDSFVTVVGDSNAPTRIVTENVLAYAVYRKHMLDAVADAGVQVKYEISPHVTISGSTITCLKVAQLSTRNRRQIPEQVQLISISGRQLIAILGVSRGRRSAFTEDEVADDIRLIRPEADIGKVRLAFRSLVSQQVFLPSTDSFPSREDGVIVDMNVSANTGLGGLTTYLHGVRRLAQHFPSLHDADRARATLQATDQARTIATADPTIGTRDGLLPPVYEKALWLGRRLVLGTEAWSAIRDGIRLAAAVLPLFDRTSVIRSRLGKVFISEYGRGATVPDARRFLIEASSELRASGVLGSLFADPCAWFRTSSETTHGDAAEDSLAQLRLDLQARILGIPVDAGVIDISDTIAALGRRVKEAPAAADGDMSYAVNLSPVRSMGIGALNYVVDDWGKYYARFAVDQFGFYEEAAPGPSMSSTANLEYVSVSRDHGFNGNARYAAGLRVLAMPGDDHIRRGSTQHISLSQVAVRHNVMRNNLELIEMCSHKVLVPLYLGTLSPSLLPPMHIALLGFMPTFSTRLQLYDYCAPLDSLLSMDDERVIQQPRVCIAGLVLSRRRWVMRRNGLPGWPAPGSAASAAYLSLERWRSAHGIPDEVYLRTCRFTGVGVVQSKPQYVDFRSPVAIWAAGRRLAGDYDALTVEEALPSPARDVTPEDPHLYSISIPWFVRGRTCGK